MKQQLQTIYNLLTGLPSWPAYLRDLRTLKSQQASATKEFPLGEYKPCLHERSSENGSPNGHYFHQDLLVAQRIFLNGPKTHVDVGSRVDGFVAHVASFRPIEVIDIRPQPNATRNIRFIQADLMSSLDQKFVDYCDSLSCLHALEHFGLGRYGDPIQYDGYQLGLDNLWKTLKRGGKLYLSVPIGPQRIEFNAHRVFSVSWLLECFTLQYKIDHFSFVDDQGDLHENVAISAAEMANQYGCWYGCGIFEMTKT